MSDPVSQVILDEDTLEIVRSLAELRARKKSIGEQEGVIRTQLLEFFELVDAEVGLTAAGMPAITLVTVNRRKVNTKKLEALYPDVYADVMEEATTVMLKLG